MQLPASVRMFLQPRATMRWILTTDPNYGVMSIAMMAGVTAFLRSSMIHGLHPLPGLVGFHPSIDAVIAYGIGATPGPVLYVATIAIAGGLFGALAVYIGSFVLWLVGLPLGGLGRYRDVRSSLAWAFVPYSWMLPVWMVAAVLFGPELRQISFSYSTLLPPSDQFTLRLIVFADYWLRLLCLWWLVVKLSVAHRYSTWRAALTVATAATAIIYLAPRFAALGF